MSKLRVHPKRKTAALGLKKLPFVFKANSGGKPAVNRSTLQHPWINHKFKLDYYEYRKKSFEGWVE
jgi:hypothetical protein